MTSLALRAGSRPVSVEALLADLRHLDAAAAGDLADWLVHLDLEGKAAGTIYDYHRQLARLLRTFPAKTVGEFTHTDVNDCLRQVPSRSRHITRSIYNRFFEWLVFDDRIELSPMRKVPTMRQPRRRPVDIYSDAEQALLEALPAPDGQLWVLLFGSGLRRSEARHLRRAHIDLARERLVVYAGKGDKDGIVPLAAPVLQAVADLDLLEQLAGQDHLWYTLADKRSRVAIGDRARRRRDPVSSSTFDNWHRRCIETAGVRYLSPHKTRHTFGYRLKEQGFDLEERSLLMRHENPNTTKRYYPALSIEDVAVKVRSL